MSKRIGWHGVFPAVTTQFREDLSLDVDATARVMKALLDDGVSGLIVCGTVGENCSLSTSEKVALMEAAKSVAGGRVPVICGVAEFTTAFAIDDRKGGRSRRSRRPDGDAGPALFEQAVRDRRPLPRPSPGRPTCR